MRKVLAACLAAACVVAFAFIAFPQVTPVSTQERSEQILADVSDDSAEASSSSAGKSAESANEKGVSAEHDGDVVDAEADSIAQGASGERCEGEVLVELADGCTAQDLNEAIAQMDCVTTESVSDDDIALGFVTLSVDPECDFDWVLDELQDCDAVAGSQPNYVYHLLEDAETVSLSTTSASQGALMAGGVGLLTQLGINDSVAISSYDNRWWLEAVGALKAWETRKTSGAVTVAVVDTGCDTSHEDLKGAVSAANCYNARTGATGLSAVGDSDGHGTHVCGIIAATPNNSKGIAGVSYGTKLMPVKVVDGNTANSSYLVKAYSFIMKRRAAGENVRVVNVSLGQSGGYDPALMRAIDQAYTKYGILSVFAAGNDGASAPYYCFPCDYAEVGLGVMSVSKATATSLRGSCYSSSNYNVGSEKTKDLSAPGVGIVSTYPAGLSAHSPYGKGYKSLTGTSMATPVVSGIAALVWAQNPSLSPGEVKSVLCSTASDIRRTNGAGGGFDALTGYGLVRADKAVAGARSCYIKGKDAVAVGSTIKLTVPQSGTWRWSSGSSAIAKVSSSGTVKGVSAGEVVISATNASTGKKLSRTIVVYSAKVKGKSKVAAGKKISLSLSTTPVATCTWSSSNKKVAKVNSTTGKVTAVGVGTAVISAKLTSASNVKASKKINVVKGPNPMKVKASVKKVKYSKLKKKARTVSKAIVFTKAAKGKVTYTKVAKGSSKYLSINNRTGKITVRKGTRHGTYKIKVKVRAAGNSSYKALTRVVVAKVKVV